ncbi:MAG: DUF6371 domain-containing protein [Candidatus Anstonellaceae archaeon]
MLWRFEKNKKYPCPGCQRKTYARLIDIQGDYLPYEFGRCDREIKCKYAVYPDVNWFKQNRPEILSINSNNSYNQKQTKMEAKKQHFFDKETYEKFTSLERFAECDLIQYLKKLFDKKEIAEVIKKYRLGAIVNGEYKGAICFPYINLNGDLAAVQVMRYDRETGRRAKDAANATNWLDNLLLKHFGEKSPEWLKKYKENETKVTCFFGEHLLQEGKPICIVEAPKTAIIAALQYPQYNWLASFNLSCMNADRLEALKKANLSKVMLFPDCGAEQKWRQNIEYFSYNYPITFDFPTKWKKDLTPEQIEDGADLADAIIAKRQKEKEGGKGKVYADKKINIWRREDFDACLTFTSKLNYLDDVIIPAEIKKEAVVILFDIALSYVINNQDETSPKYLNLLKKIVDANS